MKKSLGPITMVHPLPVWCVGSYDEGGRPNLATVAWGGICCSKPPCVAISLRKATYTYGNIRERGAYTVNVPSVKYGAEADYFGIASGRDVNKFQESGLTPIRSELVDAPYVEEFPVVLECKVIHTYEIGLHTQFIGEILDVKVESDTLGEDGKPDILKVDPIIYSTKAQGYYQVGELIGKAYSMGKKD
jgi:flavin reductase (DIM6/NTAB) family NADH-FMN oxidoreductase RutF